MREKPNMPIMAQDVSSIMLLESKENFGIKCFSFSYLTLFTTGNSDFVLVEGKTKYPYISISKYPYLFIHKPIIQLLCYYTNEIKPCGRIT